MELNSVIANRTQNWGVFSSKPGAIFWCLLGNPTGRKQGLMVLFFLNPDQV
ncbi:MAG: hypothetical protein V7K94_30120 [Nostoc sp.]|uniref:hypothetical protein n=1 Tax=Nostoc sp. TaxID=1180 RepID=UPI002FF859B5